MSRTILLAVAMVCITVLVAVFMLRGDDDPSGGENIMCPPHLEQCSP